VHSRANDGIASRFKDGSEEQSQNDGGTAMKFST
jgi:hypothetical protein